ncbi:hypothetical protein DSECCO2_623500 [anaerobic digester metagenome]
MADHVQEPIHIGIQREGKFRYHQHDDGRSQVVHHPGREGVAQPVDGDGPEGEQGHDDVLADDLERCQPRTLDEAVGKDRNGEDREKEGSGDSRKRGKDPPGCRIFPEQKGSGKERPGKEVTGGDPELRREVCVVAGEDPHTVIGEGVDEADQGHEEQPGAGDQQVTVLPHRPGIPGDGEDRDRYPYRDEFGDDVEEEVVVEAGRCEGGEKHRKGDD